MKIEGNNPFINTQLTKVQAGEQQSEREQAKATEQLDQVRDRLEFSANSVYERKVHEAPEMRAERIAEIARKLESGTYNIKAEKVAEAIIVGSIVDEVA